MLSSSRLWNPDRYVSGTLKRPTMSHYTPLGGHAGFLLLVARLLCPTMSYYPFWKQRVSPSSLSWTPLAGTRRAFQSHGLQLCKPQTFGNRMGHLSFETNSEEVSYI